MEIFWNQGESNKIKGQDVMGLRQIDQALERHWVSGITTISFRARYLTLITWTLGAYFKNKLDQSSGKAEFDWEEIERVMARLEFMILACSRSGELWGESGNTYGTIGPDKHKELLDELDATGTIKIPDGKQVGALGTYINPCRSFGLLDYNESASEIPIQITPRGKTLYEVIQSLNVDNPLANLVIQGGTIRKDDIEKYGSHFSVNGLSAYDGELAVLEDAIFKPFSEDPETQDLYRKFTSTIRWSLNIAKNTITPISSAQMIRQNFAQVTTQEKLVDNSVEMAWYEYDLYRRVHYSMELMLGGFTQTIGELDGANIDRIIMEWQAESDLSNYAANLYGEKSVTWSASLEELADQVDPKLFRDSLPKSQTLNGLSAVERVVIAFALALSTWKDAGQYRQTTRFTESVSYVKRTFDLLSNSAGLDLASAIKELLVNVVLESHLNTTLRKMAQGQKCSLRFYPEGVKFKPTDTNTIGGYSGDRLSNVMSILSDIGLFSREENTRYKVTPKGLRVLEKLRSVA